MVSARTIWYIGLTELSRCGSTTSKLKAEKLPQKKAKMYNRCGRYRAVSTDHPSSVEIDVPEKNEEVSGTPTEDVVSVDNEAGPAEHNDLVSSESTVPSFEEVKADKPSEQTETQLPAPSESPKETEQSKPKEQPVATEPDEALAEVPAPTEPPATTEPPAPAVTEPPVETQPKTAYDYEFDISAIRFQRRAFRIRGAEAHGLFRASRFLYTASI